MSNTRLPATGRRPCRGPAWLLALVAPALAAQGDLPDQAWPAGTFLSTFDRGGRINTFHRGYLYLAAEPGSGAHVGTFLYDISDPTSPVRVHSLDAAINGHIWTKIGDLFGRSYGNPDVAHLPNGSNHLSSFADPFDRGPWTQPIHDFPHRSLMPAYLHMATYPFRYDVGGIRDVRSAPTGYPAIAAPFDVAAHANLGSGINRWRIGNLLFLTPSDTQTGVAVYDIGNPLAPVLLDRMADSHNLRQYTNAWHVWRHYLLLMSGSDDNGPDGNANTVIVDFSDPTELRIDQTLPYATLRGRYVQFQDHYAFAGHGPYGSKFDMITRTEVRRFDRPATPGLPPSQQFGFPDFQWLPLGHLLVVSGAEVDRAQSFIFTHRDDLDTDPPYVGWHHPPAGARNQPRTSVVGLVVHEQLDATTVSDQTFRVRPVTASGVGAAIAGVVIHTSYQVINFTPVQPLAADTTYEVDVVAGGIRDVAGNGISPYRYRFSTGPTLIGDDVIFAHGFQP